MKRLALVALTITLCTPALAAPPPIPENVRRAVLLEWATANCDMSDYPMAALMAPVAAALIQSQPPEVAAAHRDFLRAQASADIAGFCAKAREKIPQT